MLNGMCLFLLFLFIFQLRRDYGVEMFFNTQWKKRIFKFDRNLLKLICLQRFPFFIKNLRIILFEYSFCLPASKLDKTIAK